MTPTPTRRETVEVFFSYSHKDEKLRNQLANHLSIMEREGAIKSWHDRKITAGSEWAGQIAEHLESARIILLLISAEFLASNYCYDLEMGRALERHEANEAVVIPIILKPVDWYNSPFGKLQALPRDGKAITTWRNRDEGFTQVARELRSVAAALPPRQPTPKPDIKSVLVLPTSIIPLPDLGKWPPNPFTDTSRVGEDRFIYWERSYSPPSRLNVGKQFFTLKG